MTRDSAPSSTASASRDTPGTIVTVKRRANHEGTVPRRRRDGRWQSNYTGADGKRRSVIKPTRAEAAEALRGVLADAQQGIVPVDARVTMSTYLEHWLASSVAW